MLVRPLISLLALYLLAPCHSLGLKKIYLASTEGNSFTKTTWDSSVLTHTENVDYLDYDMCIRPNAEADTTEMWIAGAKVEVKNSGSLVEPATQPCVNLTKEVNTVPIVIKDANGTSKEYTWTFNRKVPFIASLSASPNIFALGSGGAFNSFTLPYSKTVAAGDAVLSLTLVKGFDSVRKHTTEDIVTINGKTAEPKPGVPPKFGGTVELAVGETKFDIAVSNANMPGVVTKYQFTITRPGANFKSAAAAKYTHWPAAAAALAGAAMFYV